MPTVTVGRSEIAYELRRSDDITERRICVTPEAVEVVVPRNDDEDAIAAFLTRKRQWLFNAVRDMQRVQSRRHAVPRFMTGSKIPFRGRRMPLTVRRSDAERLVVTYRNGFIVDLPHWAGDDTDHLVASELRHWLKQRARKDVGETAEAMGKRFGLVPRSIRVGDLASGWGSCGPEGNVLINWHLILAPRKVMDYVVAHELAHLRHRNHGPDFWRFVGQIVPDMEAAKRWLELNESELGGEHLAVRAVNRGNNRSPST